MRFLGGCPKIRAAESIQVIFENRKRRKLHELACSVDFRAGAYFGARLANMRCKVRLCIFNRRAVSDTLRSHIS